tara:strand:+ start:3130 stop:3843 length:714 start_codon:yes stop_codon:yes gene_type:complete
MTRLSVNINKAATLRNARGGDRPNVIQFALDCELFGADGITVHPRPDERHIKMSDLDSLRKIIKTEFNIEGYPSQDFLKMVLKIKPDQVTLVPDSPDILTSNQGWNTVKNQIFLSSVIHKLHSAGIRTSIFIDPEKDMIKAAKEINADRIELYTEPYAKNYPINKDEAINKYMQAASYAHELDLGVNAGHDLDLTNLNFFHKSIPNLLEVSIGHALICDALYLGLEKTIHSYKRHLQ